MERLRSFIKSAFSYPRKLYASHPVTAVSIICATILYAVNSFLTFCIDDVEKKLGKAPMDIFLHICTAAMFFAVFALCIESIRAKLKKPAQYALYAFFGILSLFASFILSDLTQDSHVKFWEWLGGIREKLGTGTVMLYIGGLLMIALLLAVYFSYSHDIHQEFNDHVMNCQSSVFFSAIIYGVIQLGVLLLTLIVMVLLYDDAFELLIPVIILINGLFFVPAVICALIKENETAVKFYQALVRYVMLTISMLAYVIIYIYIIKLIVTRSVPSNSVFAILTALFTISMFISYSCTTFENKGFLQKFAYNSPLIFAPFILMQCYTVIVRIGQYGLTPKRYFGIAFIIFEIVYIIYYTVELKRDKEIVGRNLILVVCAFAFITVFIPGINSRALSTMLAKHQLASYLEKAPSGNVSDKEYMRANAAYGFLSDDDFGKDRLEKYFPGLDKETKDTLREKALAASKALATSYHDPGDAEPLSQNGWFSAELVELTSSGSLDVNGYSELSYVNIKPASGNADDGKEAVVDVSNLSVYKYDSSFSINESTQAPIMTVDLSDYIARFIELSSEYDANIIDYDKYRREMISIGIVDINENARLYVINADISRNEKSEPVRVDLNGYLLIK